MTCQWSERGKLSIPSNRQNRSVSNQSQLATVYQQRYSMVPLLSLLSCTISVLVINNFNIRCGILGFGAFAISYAWRSPILPMTLSANRGPLSNTLFTIVLSTLIRDCVRLGAPFLLAQPLDQQTDLFVFAWSYAVGFTTAHEVYGNLEIRAHLALYNEEAPNAVEQSVLSSYLSAQADQDPLIIISRHTYKFNIRQSHLLDSKLDALVAGRRRSQLEAQVGTPYTVSFLVLICLAYLLILPSKMIPVFLLCLQRLDSVLLDLGLTISMAKIFLQPITPSSVAIFCLLFFISLSVNVAWGTMLSRWGVHVVAYATLLVASLTFTGSLGSWGRIS